MYVCMYVCMYVYTYINQIAALLTLKAWTAPASNDFFSSFARPGEQQQDPFAQGQAQHDPVSI
jgi:hypothetical protein